MRNDFDLTWPQTSDVFLALYEELAATDVSGPLRSQYAMRGVKRDTHWKDFYSLPLTPDELTRRDASRSSIRDSISSLGIGLRTKSQAGKGSTRPKNNAVELSRQPPIAVLTTPEPSPSRHVESTSRKRRRVDFDDDEIQVASVRHHVPGRDSCTRYPGLIQRQRGVLHRQRLSANVEGSEAEHARLKQSCLS